MRKAVWCSLVLAMASLALAQPTRGGTLTVAQQADIVGLDPHLVSAYSSAVVDDQIYDSLLTVDPKGDVKPSIAEKYSVSDGGKTYTFNLRKNVKFSDGSALTSKDVVYSIKRILDPKTASPRQNDLGDVKSITAPDDFTVVITLDKPFAPFLTKIAGSLMAIMPDGYAATHNLDKEPMGSGPFKFVKWVSGDSVTLERNPHYWEAGKPYVDTLVFKALADDPTRVTNVETGNVDLIMSVPQNQIDRLKNAAGVKLAGGPGTWFDYLGLNQSKEPFNNVKVRQAMSLAVNRFLIVRTAIFGKGTQINCGPIPPSHWAYTNCREQLTNVEQAKKLMVDAGFPKGFKMVIKVGADYKSQVNIAQALQAQLKAINIDVQVVPMEWGAFIDDVVNKGNFEAVVLGWIGSIDPDDFLYYQFRSGEKFNFVKFADKEVDDLLEKGRSTIDKAARKTIYTDAQKLLAQKAAYIFLHINDQYEAFRPQVQGYVHYATGQMESLKDVWIKK